MTKKENLRYWLVINHTHGMAYSTWKKHFDQLEAKTVIENKTLIRQSRLKKEIKTQLLNPDWRKIDNEISWSLEDDNHIITYFDDKYPDVLREISSPPLILYVKGNINALNTFQIAMVGSRHASPNGIYTANQFSYALANAGFTITSGLALGIDAACHQGALRTGGQTVAVLGTGIDIIYPSKNKLIADKIQENGAIVSEFPLKTKPQAKNFPKRNRIISGLSVATLVVEASLRSGSLITAKFALEQNREVLAIPGSIHQPQSKGCHALIKQGAALIETIDDVLEELQQYTNNCVRNNVQPPEKADKSLKLEKRCSNMLQYVGFDVTPIDVIIQLSGYDLNQVTSQLSQLELDGLIQKVPGGYVKLVRDFL